MAEQKSNENLMGAVAYLLGFVTGIILLITEKNNKFIRFHAMQSTIVFGGLFILNIALGFIPVLGGLLGMILPLAWLILWVFLMFKAYSGEMYKLPVVGDFAEKQLKNFK